MASPVVFNFSLRTPICSVQKPRIDFSVTNPGAEWKIEAIVKEEILAGNYVVTPQKHTIVSALAAAY